MPNQPKPGTRVRTFRCEDAVWEAAQTKAKEQSKELADVLRAFLRRYATRP